MFVWGQDIHPQLLIQHSHCKTAQNVAERGRGTKGRSPLVLLPAAFFKNCDSVLLARQGLVVLRSIERLLPMYTATYK